MLENKYGVCRMNQITVCNRTHFSIRNKLMFIQHSSMRIKKNDPAIRGEGNERKENFILTLRIHKEKRK